MASNEDSEDDGKPWLRAESPVPAPIVLQTIAETPKATPPAPTPPPSSEAPATNKGIKKIPKEVAEETEDVVQGSSWLLLTKDKAGDEKVPGLVLTPTDSSGSTPTAATPKIDGEGPNLNVPIQRPTVTVTGVDSATTRAANTEVLLVVGDEAEKTPSTIKMERIKEQLSSDSQGNVLHSLPMSAAGRYRSRKSTVGTGMFHVDERAKQNAVLLRLKKMQEPEQPYLTDSEEEFNIASLEDDTGNLRRTVDEEFAKLSTEKEVTDEETGVRVLPAVTLDPKDMKSSDPENKGVSFATIVNLKRMRKRIGKGVITTKTFAKDEKHEALIKEHARKTAIELPLPLKMAINEEATQIVQGTVKAYTKTLGKKHPLTVEAVEFLANLKKKGDEYAQI